MRTSTYKLLSMLLIVALTLMLNIGQGKAVIKISKNIYLKGGYTVIEDTIVFSESYTGSLTFKYPKGWVKHINYTKVVVVDGEYANVVSVSEDYVKLEVRDCKQIKFYTVFSGIYVFRNRYALTFIPLALAPLELPAEVSVTLHYPTTNIESAPYGFNVSGSQATAYYGTVSEGTNILLNTSFSYTDVTWIICYNLHRTIELADYSKAVIKDTYVLTNIGPRSESKIEFKLPKSAKVVKVAGVLGEYFRGANQGSFTTRNTSDFLILEVRFRHSTRGGEKIILTIVYEVPLIKENDKYVVKGAFSSNGVYVIKSTVIVKVEGSLNTIEPEPSYKSAGEAKYFNKIVPIAELMNENLDIALKFSINMLKIYLPFIILAVFIVVLSAIGVAYVKLMGAKKPIKRPLFDQRSSILSDVKEDVEKLYNVVERVESLSRAVRDKKISRRAFQLQKRNIEKDIDSLSEEIKNKVKSLSELDSRFSTPATRLYERVNEMLKLCKDTLSLIDSYATKRIKLKELRSTVEINVSRMKRVLSTIEEIVLDMEDML